MNKNERKFPMSATALKILALILMTIDHIGAYIPDMPICLRWIGRIAAPLFFFCAAEGITHTRDKKSYLKRLWKMSMAMVLIESVLPPLAEMLLSVKISGFDNNIFLSIFQGTLVVYLLEESKGDKIKRAKYIFGYVWYQLALLIVYVIWENFDPISALGLYGLPILCDLQRFVFTALGSVLCMEGSIILTSVIVLFYLCRDSKKRLAVSYSIYCIAYFIIFVPQLPLKAVHLMGSIGVPYPIIQLFSTLCTLLGFNTIFSAGDFTQSLLYVNFQWFMIFALPFMLMYNSEKGRGLKNLFYVYYPLHLVLLYTIGAFLR